MKKIFLLITFTIISIETIFSYSFKTLGLENGLSQQAIISICQDEKGRMWLGTAEGINIYNGNNIQIYKGNVTAPNGKHIWIGNYVSHLKADNEGNIFCIADNNLYVFNIKKNDYRQLTTTGEIKTMVIKGNVLWYINRHKLMQFNVQSNETSVIKDLPETTYTSLEITETNIFMGCPDGLYVYNKELTRDTLLLAGKPIYSLFESSDKELWIGTNWNGLYRYKNQNLTNIPILPHSNKGTQSMQIREIVEDKDGNIWFGTLRGIEQYNKKRNIYNKIEIPRHLGGIDNPSIYSLFIDKQCNLWAGSFNDGICYFNIEKKTSPFQYQSVNTTRSIIQDIIMDKDNNLWITDINNGITSLNQNWEVIKQLNTQTQKSVSTNNVKSLAYDKKRNLLLAGLYLKGLMVYNLTSQEIYALEIPKNHDSVTHNSTVLHIEIWNNRIFVGSKHAIYEFNPDKRSFQYITETNDNCIDFKITNHGEIITREKYSIQIISLENPQKKRTINLLNAGYKGEINRLLLTTNGVYILTLGSGIIHYNLEEGVMTNYTKENSELPSNYCYYATYTKNNNIVIINDLGVTLFDAKKKNITFLNNAYKDACTTRDNMIYVSNQNDIYVTNHKGILKLHEEDFNPTLANHASIFFTNLYINNELIRPVPDNGILTSSMSYTKSIRLKPKQNNIKIEFANPDYTNHHIQHLYVYKLEGADKNWNYTTVPSVHYSYLWPGDYTLLVKLNANDTTAAARLHIHIETPLYAQWWALCLYAIVLILIIRTVYKYKSHQKELALSLENERFEKQKIEQLNNEKLVFYTNISHEFRTPLTLINSYVDTLLTNEDIPTSIYNLLYKLKKNALYMNNLVSELLDFRKFSQNHYVLKLNNGNFESFIREFYLIFQERARQKDIAFQFSVGYSPIKGWFDAKALEKVFFNLLSNAFKYTPEGGQINIFITLENKCAKIKILDTGVGMSPKDLSQLFNRFYQGNNQKGLETTPGTGIGLALTKTIVDHHHGQISVKSEEGKGSTFSVSIPLNREAYGNDEHIQFVDSDDNCTPLLLSKQLIDSKEVTTVKEEEILLNQTEEQVEKKKILVVEDNQELLQALASLFASKYQVILAENGQEGLEKAVEHEPDLIISDVIMPVMSGTELCTQIKNNINLCHIPIILLTALGGFEQNIEGLQRGADDYITKPFNGRLLLARVGNLIHNRLLIQSQINKNMVEDIDLTHINPIDQNLLKKVEEVLKQNLDNTEFNISDLCKEMGLGRSILFTKFKALTGMTPNNYILNYRLKMAVSLFHHAPELNISEVSDKCGFSSSNYFGKCFKKQYGMSPQTYKTSLTDDSN